MYKRDPQEGLEFCRKAYELQPNPRYGYTLAFLLQQNGDRRGAAQVLDSLTQRWPTYVDAYLLWADMLRKTGEFPAARQVVRKALEQKGMAPGDQRRLQAMAARLNQGSK